MEYIRTRIKELLEQAKANTEILAWELDALRHGLVIQWTLSGTDTLQNLLQNGLKNYLEEKKR